MTLICRRGNRLAGRLRVAPSKSSLHRLLFCAGLARGESRIAPESASQDVGATLNVLAMMGASVQRAEGGFRVDSPGPRPVSGWADVGESGSTLRFAMPILMALGGSIVLDGREGLSRRPLDLYQESFAGKGAEIERLGQGWLPLRLSGKLRAGEYRLRGDVSSQFVSGLLMALPILEGDSSIALSTPLESAAYAAMTAAAMEGFGVSTERVEPGTRPSFPHGGWIVPGGQQYRACAQDAEADWSGAAFWIAANALGADIALEGLDRESLQPDKRIVDIVAESPMEIDVSGCPDLLPILAVWAGLCGHDVLIHGAARVRLKESDRVAAMARELRAIGGRVDELPDGLDIHPVDSYSGGRVSGWNDHRVVMALAVASLASRGDIIIEGAEAVAKSYPAFFDDFRALGGKADVE
jgi:3-phosphoshikimate 1-carboxyvinyltransferase